MLSVVFVSVVGLGLAFACWYVARTGSRRRGGAGWARGRPGLRTGATLSCEDAWVVAHERIAPWMRTAAVFFGLLALTGPLGHAFHWEAELREAVFAGGVLLGVAALMLVAAVGDRAARQALAGQGR